MPADTQAMLDLAARLAYRGMGYVEPNPMVGCVICAPDGRIIGMGHHRKFGDIHAEVDALNNCRAKGNDPAGSTVYVTLEPCNAPGKQPPCVDALLKAKVAKVVIARTDPNLAKSGGAERLEAGGVEVEFTTVSQKAVRISDPFIKRVTTGLPWVIAKWAQSIDGRIATASGESKWISGEASRRRVHQLRARVDAIWTGMGTVLADNPQLTARGVPVRRIAKRVIDGGTGSFMDLCDRPLNVLAGVEQTPTIVVLKKDVWEAPGHDAAERCRRLGLSMIPFEWELLNEAYPAVFRKLAEEYGVATLLIEAGRMVGTLMQLGLIDELQVYVAPIMIGQGRGVADTLDPKGLNSVPRYELISQRRIGDDVRLVYRKPLDEDSY